MMRELAAAFSTRVLRELSRTHPAQWAYKRAATVAELVEDDVPLGDAFDAAYARLVEDYQCEYVYMSALIKHSLHAEPAANALTGIPVFLSIADVVVAGTNASAFEIKSDLDSFSRLDLQLLSYSRCFENVYIVTSERKAARAIEEVPSHVGVMTLTGEAVMLARPATGGYSRLDSGSIFRVLRQPERLAVLQRQCGYLPDVPPARLYRRTAELFSTLTIDRAYTEFVTELRGRDARSRKLARTVGLPASLYGAAAGVALSGAAWRRLGCMMQMPAGRLRAHSLVGGR